MKKEYKKILINGDEIQAKYDGFEDNDIWQKEFKNIMNKYNLDYTKAYLVRTKNNGEFVANIEWCLDSIASKNLPSVYLDNENYIVLENEYFQEITILREI